MDQEIKPLGVWLYALLWFFLPFFREERYRALYRLLKTSRQARQRKGEIDKVVAGLKPEAGLFERILCNSLGGQGFQHTARNAYALATAGSVSKKPQTFKVKFEVIYTKPEAFYYKLCIRRRTLFGSKNMLPFMTRAIDLMTDEVAQELSFACERKVTCQYDDPHFGAWYIVHTLEGVGLIPRLVKFSDMLDKYPADMMLIPWAMGVGKARKVVTLYLAKHPHLLIAGPTGGGKSNAINSFILGLMYHTDPAELQFILIDLKEGIEFEMYVGAPHLYREIVRKAEEALEALLAMSLEIDRRLILLRESGAKDLPAYNKQHPEQKLPILIGVIDEYAQLVLPVARKVRDEANRLVVRISALGRAAGIQIVVCTQYPTKEVIDPQIKINLNLKLAFRCQNATQSMVILNDPGAAILPAEALGRALFALGADIFQVQIALVSEADVKMVLARARERTTQLIIPEAPVTEEDTQKVITATVPQEPDPRTLLQWPKPQNEVVDG